MKKQLVLLLLLMFSCISSVLGAVLFQDSFGDNNTSGWSFIGDNNNLWSDSSGQLTNNGSTHVGIPDPTTGCCTQIALIDGITTPDQFTLEADVIISTVGSSDFGHIGFAWGVQDLRNFNTSYLRTHSNHVTNWSFINGSASPESHLQTPGTINNVSYHLKVDVDYNLREMTVSLDSFSTTFSGSTFDTINRNPSGGGIGLITWQELVFFDNIVLSSDTVSPVPEPSSIVLGIAALILFGSRHLHRK